MSSTMMHPTLSTGRAVRSANPGLLVRLADAWFNLRAKQRSRHHLGELDQRLLRDIGIDRATAAEEARRSVWQ
jgi:uncharacterized protein YjiS (DUF1127 family)